MRIYVCEGVEVVVLDRGSELISFRRLLSLLIEAACLSVYSHAEFLHYHGNRGKMPFLLIKETPQLNGRRLDDSNRL